MKLLYVIQRYGDKIVGGSESACRHFAERLVSRGHEVQVLTSCAHDYVDWADEYSAGTEVINGVTIHRFPVVEARKDELFGPLQHWMMQHPGSAPLFEQQRWTTLMGPQLNGQREWLVDNAHTYDCEFISEVKHVPSLDTKHMCKRIYPHLYIIAKQND